MWWSLAMVMAAAVATKQAQMSEHEVGKHLDAMLGKQPLSKPPKPTAASEPPQPFPGRATREPEKDGRIP